MSNEFKDALSTQSFNEALENEIKANLKMGQDLKANEIIELFKLLDIGTRYILDMTSEGSSSPFSGHSVGWTIDDEEDKLQFAKEIKSRACIKVKIIRRNRNDLIFERIDNRYRIVAI